MEQNTETVTFHENREPVRSEAVSFKEIDMRLLKPVESTISTDVKRILSRPVLVSQFDFNTSYTANQILYVNDLPFDWIDTGGASQVPLWQNKVDGFALLRAKIILRVQLNAMRFQQGRLLVCFFPQADLNPNRYELTNESLVLATQLPRVELDCSTNSTAILEIPYVSPTIGYQITTGSYGHGYVDIRVYSPLKDPTGPGKAGVSVWAHFEDVELYYPAYTQSGKATRRRARGGASTGDVINEELEKATGGSVSSFFTGVADVAEEAKNVPLLSSIAAPVSWAANIGSKIAGAFGWSNPSLSDASQQVVIRTAAASHNIDGIDTSQKIALKQDNSIQVLPGVFGTDVDEMAIQYVASRPAYYTTGTWADTDAQGTLIFVGAIRPSDFYKTRTITTAGTTIYDWVPLSYLANYFKYWRGSITFTFKFVKTEFHSGRLLFVFNPSIATSISFANSDYTFREVVDIRESNEFTVTIPYIANVQYLEFNQSIGTYSFYVLNELVAPDTVSGSISILTEVAGGPDFEVAVPNDTPAYIPCFAKNSFTSFSGFAEGEVIVPADNLDKHRKQEKAYSELKTQKKVLFQGAAHAPTPCPSPTDFSAFDQAATPLGFDWTHVVFKSDIPRPVPKVKSQALGTDTTEQERENPAQPDRVDTIAQSTLDSGGLAASVFCIGEKIMSLRQLLKKASLWYTKTDNSSGNNEMKFRTGMLSLGAYTSAADQQQAYYYPDLFNWFGGLYAYRRGGFRYRWFPRDSSVPTMVNVRYNADSSAIGYLPALTTINAIAHGLGPAYVYMPNQGSVEVEVPYYHSTPMVVNLNWLITTTPYATDAVYDYSGFTIRSSGDVVKFTITRQMADDCELGYFIGTVPTVTAATYVDPTQSW